MIDPLLDHSEVVDGLENVGDSVSERSPKESFLRFVLLDRLCGGLVTYCSINHLSC